MAFAHCAVMGRLVLGACLAAINHLVARRHLKLNDQWDGRGSRGIGITARVVGLAQAFRGESVGPAFVPPDSLWLDQCAAFEFGVPRTSRSGAICCSLSAERPALFIAKQHGETLRIVTGSGLSTTSLEGGCHRRCTRPRRWARGAESAGHCLQPVCRGCFTASRCDGDGHLYIEAVPGPGRACVGAPIADVTPPDCPRSRQLATMPCRTTAAMPPVDHLGPAGRPRPLDLRCPFRDTALLAHSPRPKPREWKPNGLVANLPSCEFSAGTSGIPAGFTTGNG
jgi:hypothetical protein